MKALPFAIVLALLVGCENMPWNKDKSKDDSSSQQMKSSSSKSSSMSNAPDNAAMKTAIANIKPSSAATTQPTNNNISGTVRFTQMGDDTIKVTVDLTGFAPNSAHGFHIHEKGDLSDAALLSAGAHFNPAGHKHGGPMSPLAHAGDLGNITSDANGNVKTEMTVKGISLDPNSKNNIVGRSVLVHAKDDDLKTDPSGNSGGRIAGGTIEMAK